MERLKDKKQINAMALLFTATYMVSYITRINYGTIISEMERATQISRSLLSMSLTGSFITYGAGQVISGILGDKISPKKLVSCGFITTVIMNILIPVCQNPYQMLAVWCINGFAQSFMWPPLVRLMTALFSDDDYKKVVVKISWGSSIGTMLIYFVAPLIIAVSSWRYVFLFSALCGVLMLIAWNKYAYDVEEERPEMVKAQKKSDAAIFTPIMVCVMIAIILQGMLKDGVTTWMPSYISETYNLSSEVSILSSVVLPLFSILSIQAASRLYRKVFTNPVLCAGVMFGIGTLFSLGLYSLSGRNAALSIAFSAVLTGCMHGVNLMLSSMLPAYFKNYGNVSSVSGIINSCTYIGSAISTYAIALLSEKMGWEYTLLIWIFIALSGAVICFINSKPWERKMMQ